jgi:hypothetical protein
MTMSKTRKRRVLGMTSAQLITLMILALLAVVVIFGGFIFISSSGQPGELAIFPTVAPTLVSSQPLVVPDSTEITNAPQTDTLALNEEPIPSDWKQYTNTRFEIWLPPQFESATIDVQRQARVEFYRGQGYNSLADALANDTFDYRYWFRFPQPDSVAFGTTIIVKTDVLPTYTLDEYLDQTYGANLQDYRLIGRQQVNIEGLEAQRVVLNADIKDIPIGVVDYVITDGVNLWIIRCSSTLDEFYTWLPEFDMVARSFRLNL